MTKISSDQNPYIETQELSDIASKSGNLYESIAIVSARSSQLTSDIKEELTAKLEEFATSIDNLEEVHENREQIEISKYYEKLPHPVKIALKEFMDDELYIRKRDAESESAK